MATVTAPRVLVSLVDDDESVRESLPDLIRQFGYRAESFASAAEFLASDLALETACLILDVAMPGMSGPELHRELIRRQTSPPVVFITAHRDEVSRSRMLAAGAVDCLLKPFSSDDLQLAIQTAVQASRPAPW